MKKITENELKTSTNMLREYMRVIEQAIPSAPPPIGISGTPNTGSQKYTQPALGSTAVAPPPQPRIATQQAQTPNINQASATAARPVTSNQNADIEDWNKLMGNKQSTMPSGRAEDPMNRPPGQPPNLGTGQQYWTPPGGNTTPSTGQNTDPDAGLAAAIASASPPSYDSNASFDPTNDPTNTWGPDQTWATPAQSATQAAAQTGAKKPTTAKAPAKSTAKSNPMVKDLQQKLNAMGANLKVDGIMGPSTQAAMRKYQYVTPGSQQGQMLGSQTAGMNQPAATTPATQPTPRVSGADQARGAFATESVRYSEDPTLARIIGLAGL